jgi:hypothetical protein
MSFFSWLSRLVKGPSADEYSPDETPFPKIFFGPIPTPSAEGVYEARIGYLHARGIRLASFTGASF